MKVGKMVRGFTVGEFNIKGKKGFVFSMEDDLTFNQMACLCAYAVVYAISTINCDCTL